MASSFLARSLLLMGLSLSTKRTPSIWSYSCWITRALMPSNSSMCSTWFSSRYFILIKEGRSTVPRRFGILRQPSSNFSMGPYSSIISALMNTFWMPLCASPSSNIGAESTIKSLIGSPTCGAANPTPEALYMVSHILAMSVSMPLKSSIG